MPLEKTPLPESLSQNRILEAIEAFEAGQTHNFADSTKFDLLHQGKRFPPKAIVGLAAQFETGNVYRPRDFSGGEESKCFRLLREAGFDLVPKPSATKRSEEMWTVAYFLSRCGNRLPNRKTAFPPEKLQVHHWLEAYSLFYDALGEGRTESAFSNSLKNARDLFDAHLDSGRVGWRREGPERPPDPLIGVAKQVWDQWQGKDTDSLWKYVSQFIGTAQEEVSTEPSDLPEPPGRFEAIVSRVIRDTACARALKKTYSHCCQVCGLRIEVGLNQYYSEAHHVRPLGGKHQGSDFDGNMLVLCPNHHAMFDYGIPKFLSPDRISIHGTEFVLTQKHTLSADSISYHNEQIHKSPPCHPIKQGPGL